MFEAISSFFEKVKFDYTTLASKYAWLLIVLFRSSCSRGLLDKKRAMRIEENRTFKKRQKACNTLECSNANPIQLEFDF